MPSLAKKSVTLSGVFLLIFLATIWVWAGTAQGASLDVTKTADTDDGVCDVDCSLREAIANANAGDTINIPIGTYTLTQGTEMVIDLDLTLIGAGSGDTIVQAATSSADATSRVFNITGGTVAISGVAVQNGNASDDGGGIYNSSTLTLTNVMVSNNISADGGGGIHSTSTGMLSLSNSTVSDNTASGIWGGGGGIYNDFGTLNVTNSTVSGNWSSFHGGGINNNSGTLTLSDSTVSSNTATGPFGGGGGIYSLSSGIMATMILTNSTISGNSASSKGGGFANVGGIVSLTNSTVSNNVASALGGGIRNTGTLTVTDSTVSGNTTNANGGGIYNIGTVTLTNSTISGNTANKNGGGFSNAPNLGAATLTNSTITGNASETGSGGGIFNVSSMIELINTIVAENTAPTGPDCTGSPTSLGYNLIGDDTGCSFTAATGDLVGDGPNPVDPVLGLLQDNGGPTLTHALSDGSPAIDQIPIVDCTVTADQRGVVRQQGPACDMGAFELQMQPPITACTLNLELTYVEETLTLEFEVGTLTLASWGIWFQEQGNISLKRKGLLGVTNPPILVSKDLPGYSAQGIIGVLTTLSTQESGTICSAWETVDTGAPASSS